MSSTTTISSPTMPRFVTNVVVNPDGSYTVSDVLGHTHTLKVLPPNLDEYVMLVDAVAELLNGAQVTLNSSTGQIIIKVNW